MDSSNRSNLIKMGKYIAKLRKEKGYTQKALGELLDVSDKTISKWERGDIAPDITILHSLAKELNSNVDDILCGEEHKEDNNSDESSIKMIKLYSDQTKRKLIKEIFAGLIIIVLTILFIFYIDNYHRWHVTVLKSDGDLVVRGYLISNHNESKIIIDKIVIDDTDLITNENILITSYEIRIYNKNKIIYSKEVRDIDNNYLNEILKNAKIIIDNLPNIKSHNVSIEMLLMSENDKEILLKEEL